MQCPLCLSSLALFDDKRHEVSPDIYFPDATAVVCTQIERVIDFAKVFKLERECYCECFAKREKD